jgi:hypothetical protein
MYVWEDCTGYLNSISQHLIFSLSLAKTWSTYLHFKHAEGNHKISKRSYSNGYSRYVMAHLSRRNKWKKKKKKKEFDCLQKLFCRITYCWVNMELCRICELFKCASCNRWSYNKEDKSTSCSSRLCAFNHIKEQHLLILKLLKRRVLSLAHECLTSKYFSKRSTNSW